MFFHFIAELEIDPSCLDDGSFFSFFVSGEILAGPSGFCEWSITARFYTCNYDG